MSIAEHINSIKAKVGAEPHHFASITVPKGPCVLPTMLDSGSGILMIRERGPQRIQDTWAGVQMVFPSKPKFAVAISDGRSTLLTQQICLLAAFLLTPCVHVGIKLAVTGLQGTYDELVIGS